MKTSYYTKLAGVSFRQDAVAKLKDKNPLRCVAEPENEYDKYAVKVEALLDEGWTHIGYIAKGKNTVISELLQSGKPVSITLHEVTGLDKDTLGVNVAIEYGDDSALDPADMRDFESQGVFFGDSEWVLFDPVNHRAYDENGHELLSGSMAEHMFAPDVDLTYPAKALAKSTGTHQADIMALWDTKRDLSADLGTLVHKALEKYLLYSPIMRKVDENKEREHTAKNWLPEYLGDIVDKFVATSGLRENKNVEVRIKKDTRTGIVDCLLMDGDEFQIWDYKVTNEIKDVKYKVFGKKQKYTVQQNFYREILEDLGMKCTGMLLWQWDGTEWSSHTVPKVNVKENL